MNIEWSSQSLADIEDILLYIAQDNVKAALETERRIRSAVETSLSLNPFLGRPGRVEDTREFIIPGTPYIAPYRVKNNRLEILRVYHAARQWPESL